MNKLKVLVVEDEIIIADNICDTLEELGYEPLEPEINFSQAIESIENETPDIAILDIQLSGKKTGIDVAREINKKYHFPFIFLTSNSDKYTVSEAKEVNPAAYLIKPFSKEELYSTIEVALYNFAKNQHQKNEEDLMLKEAFFIKVNGIFQKINFKEIFYIKSSHVYVELFMQDNQKYVIRKTLTEVLENLSNHFIRIHRGYVVNLQFLDKVTSHTIFINSIELPIGKKYKENVLHRINII
ncbi:MAG: response regulator [Flavobacteriaceae bacterium]|nr:response regulator [Flavobacteriaceae bacterium]